MAFFIVRRLSSAIVIGGVAMLLAACSGTTGGGGSEPGGSGNGASSGATASDGTTPAPSDAGGFCARQCIEADQPACESWAKDLSDAFLLAFEACGDDPACIDPKLQAAALTDRQRRLADDYCEPCGGTSDPTCVDRFWTEDGPGDTLRMFSDEKLDEVESTCFPALSKNKGSLMAKEMCALSLSTCTLDFLKELGTVVCRTRR